MNEKLKSLSVGLPQDIHQFFIQGNFSKALDMIDYRLQEKNLPEELRNSLLAHREIIRRIPVNYPYCKEEAIALVKEHIHDFTENEFDELLQQRRIRWIFIDGEQRFVKSFYRTLCKGDHAFARRAKAELKGIESSFADSSAIRRLNRCIEKMKKTGSCSHRIRIRATVKLNDEHFIPGMFLRVHLPIAAACVQQKDIRIEKLFPEGAMVDEENALQRTVCWEKTMHENHEFMVEYSYIHTANYHEPEKIKASVIQPSFYTEEKNPHIVFTPYLQQLTQEVIAEETNPVQKARKIYDFITLNMNYTFMPDYFTLIDIVETGAKNFNGDCGVFALMFITMCRCAGIPARWQGGYAAEPEFLGGHDWAQFYVAPYGWLFADPSYGIAAVRRNNEEHRQFYFGNLDAFRTVISNDFQAPFTIKKNYWRHDPYDNQDGEMESSDRGFLYSEFEHNQQILSFEEIKNDSVQ